MKVEDPNLTVIIAVGAALVVALAGACVILAVGEPVPTALWAAASALSGALVGILVPPSRGSTAAETAAAQAAFSVAHSQAVDAATQAAKPLTDAGRQDDAPAETRLAADAAGLALEEVKRQTPGLDALMRSISRANLTPEAAAAAGATAALAGHQAAAQHAVSDAQVNAGQVRADGAQARAAGAEAAQPAPSAQLARSRIMTAAAKGAATAPQDAVKAGVDAAQAVGPDGLNWRIIVLLIVAAAAFLVGIVLSLQTGHELASAPTEYDTAVKNAADTLVALGSAAGGAALGLLAPSSSTKAPANG